MEITVHSYDIQAGKKEPARSVYGGVCSGPKAEIKAEMKEDKVFSVRKREGRIVSKESAAKSIFMLCGLISVLTVAAISVYLLAEGLPALIRVGWKEILFGAEWNPAAAEPDFGIARMILTSAAGAFLAVLAAVPAGVLTAVFLAEISGPAAAAAVRTAVELLAGIPSVIYGLLGVSLLNPLVYRLERRIFADSSTHRFTGGANLLSASLVLAVMILPTIINISENALRQVAADMRAASYALGASRIQTVFRVVLPAARPGIVSGVILGLGRALGEASAIMMIAGNSVDFPLPFRSVRFLTATIVSEMGYSRGTHREMLFTLGLVLFVLIMILNFLLNGYLKNRKTGNTA